MASDLDSQVTEIIELLERSVVFFAGLKVRDQDRERGYELFPYSEESPRHGGKTFWWGFDMVLEYKPGRTNQIKLPTH